MGTPVSQDTKDKISKTARLNPRKIRKNRKTIYYEYNRKIIVLQSTYEFILANNLTKANIKWQRPSCFPYIDASNKLRHYYPDFYLTDYNVYLDPKNDYLIKVDEDKIKRASSYNNIRILILSKNQLDWNTIKSLIL